MGINARLWNRHEVFTEVIESKKPSMLTIEGDVHPLEQFLVLSPHSNEGKRHYPTVWLWIHNYETGRKCVPIALEKIGEFRAFQNMVQYPVEVVDGLLKDGHVPTVGVAAKDMLELLRWEGKNDTS